MKTLTLEELLAHRVTVLTEEAVSLDKAAVLAAQNGMFESGASFRNRAAGIRRALELIQPITESKS